MHCQLAGFRFPVLPSGVGGVAPQEAPRCKRGTAQARIGCHHYLPPPSPATAACYRRVPPACPAHQQPLVCPGPLLHLYRLTCGDHACSAKRGSESQCQARHSLCGAARRCRPLRPIQLPAWRPSGARPALRA
jgi:hypothetical protein